MTTNKGILLAAASVLAVALLCSSATAWGEAAPAEEEAAAPAAAEETAAPAATPPPTKRAVPERLARLGRVEQVLLQNEDPESAIDFAQETLREHGDDAQLRLLMGACLMQLRRYGDAATEFQRAATLSSDDATTHLHALYNLARAQRLAGQLEAAAEAYGRYITHARAHEDLDSFVDEAERLAAVVRARAEAAGRSSTRRRPRESR